ncbi:hypothetical protein [Chryseobacterium proteolyticum]|uniref:hypothetical protein n=1 Tax=Chryseobacterium proteolyticum TaxID=118127 RepID=UPI003983D46B
MKMITSFLVLIFINCTNPKEKIDVSLNRDSIDSNTKHAQLNSSKEIVFSDTSKSDISENNSTDNIQDSSNIIKYLPGNYSTTGTVDYTNELQKAFNENKDILMPNFPIAVNFSGLSVKSDSKITFQSGSKLIVLPNSNAKYQALLIKNINNVKIINPVLVGDRDQHTGTTGEWGMGINILSSSNITIVNPKIKNFWGDAIYIGRNENSISYCNTIKVTGGILDNNRRNGISIISGKDITVSNMIIKNTNGTSPMAGIDLEPNLKDELLYNINLNNITTINNKIDGIKVVFQKLTDQNKVLINIDNHNDQGSPNPLTLVGLENVNNDKLSGVLNYTNPKWNNMNSKVKVQRALSPNLKLNINQVNVNGKMLNKSIK